VNSRLVQSRKTLQLERGNLNAPARSGAAKPTRDLVVPPARVCLALADLRASMGQGQLPRSI
jgi:hypothetical protein